MTFEELGIAHFIEWESPLLPREDAMCGFAARHLDGSLAAICVFYADEGDWFAAFARRGVYPACLHREVLRAIAALQSVGVKEIKATPDPEIPRAREYMERLGFVPTGEGDNYVKRLNH